MVAGKSSILRFPLMILAGLDLMMLIERLQPWSDIHNLPGQGTVGYDPIICLIAYLVLFFVIGGSQQVEVQKALSSGLVMAIPTGLLCIGAAFLAEQQTRQHVLMQTSLMAAALVFPGIAGFKGAKFTKNAQVGIVAGSWTAMVAALMAVAVILARIDMAHPAQLSNDPWLQYQGLAIGNDAIQALVHSLNMATGFLLIAPLVGGTAGLFAAVNKRS